MSGLELAVEMPKRGIVCPVIIVTGIRASADQRRQVEELGIFQFFEKPIDPDILVAEVRRAIASVAAE
jgi:DNA-binding NtrC family response regulator